MSALHRLLSCITLGCTLLLAACGSGSTFEPLNPSRVISFGDGWSDLTPGAKMTVNDGTVNIWVERVATSYGKTITAQVSGGLGFAQNGARISGANSIANQITTFLAANTIGASDLLIIDAGVSELAALAIDPANATDSALAIAADAAGRALALQVLRLTAANGKHVVIANSPDLGKTPFAATRGRAAGFTAATRAFNDGLKIGLANVTNSVLLIDNEAYVTTLYTTPSNLGGGGNATAVACPGVASACTAANANPSYGVYLFADDRHITPRAHNLLGENAYNKIKARW
ncbi:SGNH/GDSL hydrolase family protein [Variovorax sp. PCZ-1]|uniref:SGNH/GDSL hydrolase family protein n=1 Tax=Variovorax sp. PCZ-1 TaxID=2835533 RepID=UPI001BCB58AE|nr:SGNH/GDSL hydrolase family protein [Variovorax sp. PCZ-1]MBS7806057.1 hypothetical protein [Variovorax sp. PCZ-1]